MKIPFKNFSLFVDTTFFNKNRTTLLFIHGFTGSSKDWKNILPQIDQSFSCVAIDLIGHGNSPSPEEITFYEIDSIVEQIKTVLDELKINKVILTAYSMGGRVTLNFANTYPQFIKGLILESTTPGIKDETERKERFENDKALSQKILDIGTEKFAEYWMNLPIFSSQNKLPEKILETIKTDKSLNNPVGLANSLIGFSTGKMDPLWSHLNKLNFPVLLIAGELDSKYNTLNQKMNDFLPSSELHIVKNAGHNIHLEKPSEFIILVNSFLQTIFE